MCGQGIYAVDTNGNHIASPNPVILYHELSHAFRYAMGQLKSNEEESAATDENDMRSQLALVREIHRTTTEAVALAVTVPGAMAVSMEDRQVAVAR